ncbi:hypothetical protein [Rhodothermus bifroesti]|uniref:hypothetical protein n=1 Tax=Rhodothermus bifroesti TaxID=2823335 RepID=UPI000CACF62A|nr:hypothetical protein [Rhodothermus bifroesti]GBD02712.1 hypothetical protein HRbin18_02460 [bacterium HR18]
MGAKRGVAALKLGRQLAVPQILKVFYEEPAALEPETLVWPPVAGAPCYYRVYLAGTDLERLRIGLTALLPEAFVPPLCQVLQHWPFWWQVDEGGDTHVLEADVLGQVVAQPDATAVLIGGKTAVLPVFPALLVTADRQESRKTLQALLNDGCLVALREPAHHGYDWHLFADVPLLASFKTALQAHPCPAVRRFLVPYSKARTEERFYFEQWMLDGPSLPDYIQEI